jgi:hypothetical protein
MVARPSPHRQPKKSRTLGPVADLERHLPADWWRTLFNATYAGLTKADFAWMLSDSAGMAPQYGAKARLCAFLNSTARDTPSSPAPPNAGFFLTGWPALEAFAAWTSFRYGPSFGSSCYYSTACLSSQANASSWSDTTTWVLQCCNEVAL